MADLNVITYAPDAVNVSVGGVPLSGFSDGTHINIELDGDGTQVRTGNDGTVARSMSARRTATVTLNMMQGGTGNTLLTGLWVADQVSKAGIFPIFIENLTGDELFAAGQAWIIKPPAQGLEATVANREWRLTAVVADLSKFFSTT